MNLKQKLKILWILLFLPMVCALTGCKPSATNATQSWHDFIEALTNINHFASTKREQTYYLSSSDPVGGNMDYNNFAGLSKEDGWVVLADIKGPGCIDRIWCTGVFYGHPFKIYFDGERSPRIEGALENMFGGQQEPFIFPFSQHVNQCWWSYVPITFTKSLRIETQSPPTHPFWGPRRFYYQVNYRKFDHNVESFPTAAVASTARPSASSNLWRNAVKTSDKLVFTNAEILVTTGRQAELFSRYGAAILPAWSINVTTTNKHLPVSAQNALLQHCILQIYYDGLDTPSVSVPLGDFFCNGWRKRNLSCLALMSLDGGYVWRLPTPFHHAISMALYNTSPHDVVVNFSTEPLTPVNRESGYLHAIWNKSDPTQKGQPHALASLQGPGKYIGCFLGVTSLDQSWWILEGDDIMNVDGTLWKGTGLEDYFNGGWYYRGCSFSALSGVLDRYPFRTAQYRFHFYDATYFTKNFSMSFERGDQNVSAGWMRSTAYFYLNRPQGVPDSSRRQDLAAEQNIYEHYSLMLQLFELERALDYKNCISQIDEWMETNPDDPDAGVLRLRQLEYQRLRKVGFPHNAYEPFLNGTYGAKAQEQARLLTWFYEKPNRYLVGACINAKGRINIDDQLLMTEFHPLRLQVKGIELKHGRHSLHINAIPNSQAPWIQVAVRGHNGIIGTGPGCRIISSNGRESVQGINVMRGPPHDEHYVQAEPNAFILMQSHVFGVRANDWDWHKHQILATVDFHTENMTSTPYGQLVVGISNSSAP